MKFAYFYFYLSRFNTSTVKLPKTKIISQLNKDEIDKVRTEGKSCNILVMGVDIGTPGATNTEDPKRTDTLILAHYNGEDKKIDLVSIPRDTLIRINGKDEKINAAKV